MANNARLTDPNLFIAAGIDPNTRLPIKMGTPDCQLKEAMKRLLRVKDEQQAVNRYVWYNLPSGLSGQLLERMLYYRGQLAFFYMPTDDNFYLLPYALDGTIDVYGRFKSITPVPFNGVSQDNKEKAWITGLSRKPIYNLADCLDPKFNMIEDACVLLHDYAKQISQTIIPRQILNDNLIEAEAEAYPLARTSLIANSGIKGMRVNSQDEQSNVKAASRAITHAALTGDPWVPIVGQIEFQELTDGSQIKSEEYLVYMQSLDNFRASTYGLSSSGIFEKKAQMLESEHAMNCGNDSLVYQDGLTIRQNFCDMVNAIWGLGIWCEPSELVIGTDLDGDGDLDDDKDQSGAMPGEQPEAGGEDYE